MGERYSLNNLVTHTLEDAKIMHSEDAPKVWKAGGYTEVEEFCLKDCELVFNLWKYGIDNGVVKGFDMNEEEMNDEWEMTEDDLLDMANAETTDDKVVIRRELKFANFEYDEDEKTITIETRTDSTPIQGHVETDLEYAERIANLEEAPINGRIKLNKVYSFALLRFVIRIAQRNWFRKVKK